jgi:hypothetical protein
MYLNDLENIRTRCNYYSSETSMLSSRAMKCNRAEKEFGIVV